AHAGRDAGTDVVATLVGCVEDRAGEIARDRWRRGLTVLEVDAEEDPFRHVRRTRDDLTERVIEVVGGPAGAGGEVDDDAGGNAVTAARDADLAFGVVEQHGHAGDTDPDRSVEADRRLAIRRGDRGACVDDAVRRAGVVVRVVAIVAGLTLL